MPLSRRKIKCYVTFTNFIGTVFSVNLRIMLAQIIHQTKVSLFTTGLISLNDKSFHIKNAIVARTKKIAQNAEMKVFCIYNFYGRHLFTGFPLKFLFL